MFSLLLLWLGYIFGGLDCFLILLSGLVSVSFVVDYTASVLLVLSELCFYMCGGHAV